MQTLTVPLSESLPNSNNKKEVTFSSRVNEVIKRIVKSKYTWAGAAGIVIADLIDDTSMLRPVLGSALGKLQELFVTYPQNSDHKVFLPLVASPGVNISDNMSLEHIQEHPRVEGYDFNRVDKVIDSIRQNPNLGLQNEEIQNIVPDLASGGGSGGFGGDGNLGEELSSGSKELERFLNETSSNLGSDLSKAAGVISK